LASSGRSTAPLVPLLWERLWPPGNGGRADLWVQGVSMGEVEIAATFVKAVLERRPSLPTLVTASTPAGVALLARRFAQLPVRMRPFPLDLPFSVRRFFAAVRPKVLALVETEIWPLVLREAARSGTAVLLVSARLSERSVRRFGALGPLARGVFERLTHVSARSGEDAARFRRLGVPEERLSVDGDLKLDRPLPEEPSFAPELRRLAGGRQVVVAGSVAEEEVAPVLRAMETLRGSGLDALLLLAPRRPDAFESVAAAVTARGLLLSRRSELEPGAPPSERVRSNQPHVFLLDSLGELAASYRLGDVAFLGGTLVPRGGHNVLEPLRAGLPTLHGPSTANIRETLRRAEGAVFAVDGADELADGLGSLLRDSVRRDSARQAAARLFREHEGAAGRAAGRALALLDGAA